MLHKHNCDILVYIVGAKYSNLYQSSSLYIWTNCLSMSWKGQEMPNQEDDQAYLIRRAAERERAAEAAERQRAAADAARCETCIARNFITGVYSLGKVCQVGGASCDRCGGSGQEDGSSELSNRSVPCRKCGGNGRQDLWVTCPSCHGSGKR